jgi:hypothetical protein
MYTYFSQHSSLKYPIEVKRKHKDHLSKIKQKTKYDLYQLSNLQEKILFYFYKLKPIAIPKAKELTVQVSFLSKQSA